MAAAMVATTALVVPAVADAPAPGTGTVLTADNGTASGILSGGANGSFAWYWIQPAARKTVLLTLDVDKSANPGSNGTMGQGIGFDVYRASDGAWIAHAGAFANDPNATSASAAISNSGSNLDLVQVYNYTSIAPNFVLTANFAPTSGTDTDKGAPVLTPGQYAAGHINGGGQANPAFANILLDLQSRPFLPVTASIVLSNSTKALVMGLGDGPGQPSTQSKTSQFKVGANLWSGSKLLACNGPSLSSGINPVKTSNALGGAVICTGTPFVYSSGVYGNAAAVKGPTDVRWLQWNAGAMNAGNGDVNAVGLQIFDYVSGGGGSLDYSATFIRNTPPSCNVPGAKC
jgi:hypothetical protein